MLKANSEQTMVPTFFEKQSDFRKWLEKNHKKETELLVGFFKVDSGKPSMTWSQSVDVALCFGWIDGVRKSIDKDSYQIRSQRRYRKRLSRCCNGNCFDKAMRQNTKHMPAARVICKSRTGPYNISYARASAAVWV